MKPANITTTTVINTESQFGKLVWEEAVGARHGYERRIAIAEHRMGYIVLAAVCDASSRTNPRWMIRSSFKETYGEAWAIAEQLYKWTCECAREAGFVPPCDALKAAVMR